MSANPIGICMMCRLSTRPPHVGRQSCTVDGRDIIDHATKGDCPKEYYAVGLPPPLPPPAAKLPDIPLAGDVVEAIAKRIGADRLAKLWTKWTGKPCGCKERKALLNAASARLLRWLGRNT